MKGALAFLLCVLATNCFAQTQTADRKAADVLACITLPVTAKRQPSYPSGTSGGRVRIQAEFTAPDAPPKVTILETSGNAELDAAVERFVSKYRVPCMQPGDAVSAEQNFVFGSDSPTTFGTSLRASAKEDETLVACVTRVDKATQPEYPDSRILGSVLVEATFHAPDAEPDITIAAAAPSQRLNDAAREFMRGYRVPCLNGRVLQAWQLFRFRGATHELSTTVRAYLKLTRDGRHPPVEFDLQALGCPFKVGLQYWEPVRRNQITGTFEAQPARRPFLDWLASLRLNVDANPDIENLLLGEHVSITVPCGKIDP